MLVAIAPVSSAPLPVPTAHAEVVFEIDDARTIIGPVAAPAAPAATENVAELPAVESVRPASRHAAKFPAKASIRPRSALRMSPHVSESAPTVGSVRMRLVVVVIAGSRWL